MDEEMITINNLVNNSNIKITAEKGPFKVLEHQYDLSVLPQTAAQAYFSNPMNVRRKQLL